MMGRCIGIRLGPLLVALVASAQVGCDSGLRIGSWSIFKPSSLPPVTRIEVLRSATSPPHEAAGPAVNLSVDFMSGQASIGSRGGGVLPLHIEGDRVSVLREHLRDPAWTDYRTADKDAAGEALVYVLVAHVEDQEHLYHARWLHPSEEPPPAALRAVVDFFDHAYRQAHPLSRTVDLVE